MDRRAFIAGLGAVLTAPLAAEAPPVDAVISQRLTGGREQAPSRWRTIRLALDTWTRGLLAAAAVRVPNVTKIWLVADVSDSMIGATSRSVVSVSAMAMSFAIVISPLSASGVPTMGAPFRGRER